jgi:hypothetical protein
MMWDESTIKMRDYEMFSDILSPINDFYWHKEILESQALNEASSCLKRSKILDAKYEPADLDKIVQECEYLTVDEQMLLLSLLYKYEYLFDGSLCIWHNEPYNIEPKSGAKPFHSRPFSVSKIHEATLKIELECLVKLGILKCIYWSEWAVPTFIIPKKGGSICLISDFMN